MDRRVSEADPRPHGARGAPVHRERAAAGAHRHRNRAVILDLSSSRDLLLALLPELVLTAWSLVLLLLIAWRHRTAADLRLAGCVTLAALASTAGAVWWLWWHAARAAPTPLAAMIAVDDFRFVTRSEEHTSELQSPCNLVCRLLLEKKKKTIASQVQSLNFRLEPTR